MNILSLDSGITVFAYVVAALFYLLAIIYVSVAVKLGNTKKHTILYLSCFGFRYILLLTGLDVYLDSLYSNLFHVLDLILQVWGFVFVFTAYYINLSSPRTVLLALFGAVVCSLVMIFIYAPSVVGFDVNQREYVYRNTGALIGFLLMIIFVFSLFLILLLQSYRMLKRELSPVLIARYSYMLASTGSVCIGSFFALIGVSSTYFLGSSENIFLFYAELIVIVSFLFMFPVLIMFFLPNWIQERVGLLLKQMLVGHRIKKLKRISLVISDYCEPYVSEESTDLDYELQKIVTHIVDGLPYLREGDPQAKLLASLLDPIESMFPEEQVEFLLGVKIA